MIEVIYKDENQDAKGDEGVFSVPKNIRQIGMISEDYRIYMEDYVYTFLRKAAGAGGNEEEQKNCLAILTGDSRWAAGVTYVFVKGAFVVENAEASAEHLNFSDEVWKKIQENADKYFEGQKITGWFFSQRSMPLEATEIFQKTHLKHFGGGEKVLMLMDPAEKEEAFFRYENNFLVRQSGYYLYYEKNPQMQAYMLEKNPEISGEKEEEVQDEAVKAFRKIIRKKKTGEETEAEEKTSVFSYAATACLVLAVAAVGIRFFQNYQNMQEVRGKTEAVSAVMEEEKPAVTALPKEESGSARNTREENSDDGQDPAKAMEAEETETSRERDPDTDKTEESVLSDDSETSSSGQALSEEDEAIYREESDVRKAERRVQEAEKKSDDSGENTGAEEEEETTAAGETSYVIRPGDTLYQISVEKYGTMEEVPEICRINGISEDDIIYPGQIIVLP